LRRAVGPSSSGRAIITDIARSAARRANNIMKSVVRNRRRSFHRPGIFNFRQDGLIRQRLPQTLVTSLSAAVRYMSLVTRCIELTTGKQQRRMVAQKLLFSRTKDLRTVPMGSHTTWLYLVAEYARDRNIFAIFDHCYRLYLKAHTIAGHRCSYYRKDSSEPIAVT